MVEEGRRWGLVQMDDGWWFRECLGHHDTSLRTGLCWLEIVFYAKILKYLDSQLH